MYREGQREETGDDDDEVQGIDEESE